MPGQTRYFLTPLSRAVPPSMEGRAIARPNPDDLRAGTCDRAAPSMEGRAIARPNDTLEDHRKKSSRPSMEGRAIARPNYGCAFVLAHKPYPSMEGRAIARPNPVSRSLASWMPCSFNGGPGNCPAKPERLSRALVARTRPSMEGRAIARPNPGSHSATGSSAPAFNGGPGNCPAKLDGRSRVPSWFVVLQWRAGQLPGQTRRLPALTGVRPVPSMEGRAIARPNLYRQMEDNK